MSNNIICYIVQGDRSKQEKQRLRKNHCRKEENQTNVTIRNSILNTKSKESDHISYWVMKFVLFSWFFFSLAFLLKSNIMMYQRIVWKGKIMSFPICTISFTLLCTLCWTWLALYYGFPMFLWILCSFPLTTASIAK